MAFLPRFPQDVPRLEDGVVTLRAHRLEDTSAVHEQCQDPAVQRWTTVPVPYTPEDARQFVTELVPGGWEADRTWAFAVDAPGAAGPRFLGTVELRDLGDGRAEVAYAAHPWGRGRGHVARALELLLAWGFAEKGLRTVLWQAHRGNWASRRTAWRVGFCVDGTVRQWLPQRGELRDAWVGVLTAEDERRPRHPWYDVPRIVGEQVVLREYRTSDVPRIVEACTDERTSYWLSHMPSPYTEQHAREWLEDISELRATGAGTAWAVADRDDDRMLGVVTAFDVTPEGSAEIGYWLHPEARGRGLAAEATRLLVRHCFVDAADGGLGLRRLQAAVAEGNRASARVLVDTGFVETGRRRRVKRLRDGSLVDLVDHDLLLEEWTAR
jgi:RimJ/RimL family protein N-acetyltransferase